MQKIPEKLIETLEKNNFRVSTDTRKEVAGTVYFGIKGENFDGAQFANDALEKGALMAVTENSLEILQEVAKIYREKFSIPIITIGGSNGKTTSKELCKEVLKIKYKVHATEASMNNHLGVPITILSMPKETEIAVLEIGANHPKEHTDLLNIINPNYVVVTNNGLDHLEGFGSPVGVRNANKEIYDWAKENNAKVFVNQNHKDLVEDSVEIKKENLIYYAPEQSYKTKLFGNYNFENIALAMKLAEYFDVNINDALMAIENYEPSLKRSETIERDGIKFVVDCYNANPTSMQLALESFLNNTEEKEGENKKALILGDMLELGNYSKEEHEKILKSLEILNKNKNIKTVMLIGENFKNALSQTQTENKPDNNNSENKIKYECFKDSDSAKAWFETQDFSGYTILLKGSRGMRVEKVIGL